MVAVTVLERANDPPKLAPRFTACETPEVTDAPLETALPTPLVTALPSEFDMALPVDELVPFDVDVECDEPSVWLADTLTPMLPLEDSFLSSVTVSVML